MMRLGVAALRAWLHRDDPYEDNQGLSSRTADRIVAMLGDSLNQDAAGGLVVGPTAIEFLLAVPGHPAFTEEAKLVVAALAERHPA